MTNDVLEKSAVGDEVMKQIGMLEGHIEELKRIKDENEIEPEEVGSWKTTIGKPLRGNFKV